MSLSKCLKKITTIEPSDIAEIKKLTKQYRDKGVDRKTASVNAVEDVMESLIEERNLIARQVINAGGIEEEMDLDEFLSKIEKEETINVGPTKHLGDTSQGTLEGISAEKGQSTESGRGPGSVANQSARADVQSNGGANVARGERTGGVATDEGTISISAARDRDITPSNYKITASDKLGAGGAKTKYKSNVDAIRLLKELDAQDRQATNDEQSQLVKYVGWGGIPQVFDAKNDKWKKEYSELKEILTDEEYKAARRSTQDAHYTAKPVIEGIYKGLMRLGFRGGRILEPSVGTGNFLGLMTPTIKANSKVTGVELDHITGGIAKHLYPSYNIHAPLGFQEISIPNDWFDAAIGNPPFGNQKIFDKSHKDLSKFSIHNYFFAKSIEKLRPGGVQAMVVSSYLMDSGASQARNWLAERTNLLGAIRLPNNAFKENAGTEVTTDIIFLQKKETGDLIKKGSPWTNTGEADGITINEYFIANPKMMLGNMELISGQFGDKAALIAPEGQNIKVEIDKAIKNLPEKVYKARIKTTEELTNPDILVSKPEDIKIYGYGIDDSGNIVRRLPDVMGEAKFTEVEVAGRPRERMTMLIDIRGKLRKLMHEELSLNSTEQELDNLRAALNRSYDQLVKKNGYIQGRSNKLAFRDDADYPLLAALEVDYDAGISAPTAKKQGVTPRKATAKKADIFNKRVLKPYIPPASADTAQDALMITLSEKGRVDIERITELTGMNEAEILEELSGVIYKDPESGIVTADEYLSGNVKHKLSVAFQYGMEAGGKIYKANVKALRLVQPKDIEAIDIDVRLGSPWVDSKDIQDFIKELIGTTSTVRHEKSVGKWYASIPSDRSIENTATWGTERAPASKLIPMALSGKTAAIYDPDGDGGRIFNSQETTAANSKLNDIQKEFSEWIWRDKERRTRLHRFYNDTFNTNRLREFDGAHLTLPGSNPAIKLRDHQKNVIWRLIQEGKGLLDHVVGAGKTFAMIGAVMERKRMGLHNKPMVVVPNHLVGQWAADFMLLYPGAKVLLAGKKDFEKKNRQLLFSRIATGDWDAVVIAHSSFEKIPMPQEEEKAFLGDQVADIVEAIAAAKEESGKSPSIKDLEKTKDRLEAKMQAAQGSKVKDDVVDFSEIGVDAVYLDEAHEFKNLFFSTTKSRLSGLGDPSGSQKAFDMFVKTQYIQRINNGSGVVFATGTPISNTVAEMFTVQRYLQNQELKDRGLHHFDAWANVFGAIKTDWELDATGMNYRMHSRFAEFVNVSELLTMYQGVADVITLDKLKETAISQGKRWPTPKIKSGGPQNSIAERSQDQAVYMDEIIERAQNVGGKDNKDNMLVITNDARKMALDMRLVDPMAKDFEGSKVNEAVDKIKSIYSEWNDKKGVQLVFIDLSTPKGNKGKATSRAAELQAKANEGDEKAATALEKISMDELLADQGSFSVYDDIKAKLIDKGIKESEVAFIHDANTEIQKEKLFERVNRGEIRVLLGSTAKMGAGMNVQKKLVALHHLDAPWRPSDVEQREGRIIRQGNSFYEADPEGFEIEIIRYATKKTYDSRMWQTLEGKALFIAQLRQGKVGQRTVEDIGGQAASFADLKAAATGNPLILEQVKLAGEIRKLDALKINHQRSAHRIQDTVSRLEDSDARADRSMANLKADIKVRDANILDKTNFTITVNNGKPITDKTKAGKELFKHIASFTKDSRIGETYNLADYRGFKVTLMRAARAVNLIIHGESGKHKSVYGESDDVSASGVITRLNNTLDKLDIQVKHVEKQKARESSDYKAAKESLNAPFKQEQEYKGAIQKQKFVMAELGRLKDANYPGMDIDDVLSGKEPPAIPDETGGVKEEGGLYSGYERDTTSVREPDSDQATTDDLYAPSGVPSETTKTQVDDNFKVSYKQIEVSQLSVATDTIDNAADAAHVVSSIRKHAQETMLAVVIDESNKVIHVIRHSKGAKDSSIVSPVELAAAIGATEGAAGVWFAHNHPSGKLIPSSSDKRITMELDRSLEASGVEVKGHVIVGKGQKFHLLDKKGDSLGEKIIMPGRRNLRVPVTERLLRRKSNENAKPIVNAKGTVALIGKLGTKNGLLLLDNQHAPIGIITMSPEEISNLRSEGQVPRLLKAINTSNAAAGIVISEKESSAQNLGNYLSRLGDFRLLDGVVFENGKPYSMAEKGEIVGRDSDVFYSVAEIEKHEKTWTRRRFLGKMAGAAVIASGPAFLVAKVAGKNVTIGKANPIPENILKSHLSDYAKSQVQGKNHKDGARRINNVLNDIIKNGPIELRSLAQRVKGVMPKDGITISTDSTSRVNAHGEVSFKGRRPHLTLYTASGLEGHTIATFLHESLHVAVGARYKTISSAIPRSNDKVLNVATPKSADALSEFYALYREFRRAADKNKVTKSHPAYTAYATAKNDPDEFFVRALTDPSFQDYLSSIEYKGKTLMQRFVRWIKTSLFGLKVEGYAPSWLDAALMSTDDLIKAMKKDDPNYKRVDAIKKYYANKRGGSSYNKADQNNQDTMLNKASVLWFSKDVGVDSDIIDAIRAQEYGSKDLLEDLYREKLRPVRESMKKEVSMLKEKADNASPGTKTWSNLQHRNKLAEFKKLEEAIAELYKIQARGSRDKVQADEPVAQTPPKNKVAAVPTNNKTENLTGGREYTGEQKAAIQRGGFGRRSIKKSISDRISKARENAFIKIRQGFVDQFDSFKSVLGNDKAWMMSHLTNSAAGAVEALLQYGRPALKDNVVTVDTEKKSFQEIIEPLGEELNDWLSWVAGNRAEKLKIEGKENLFSGEDIVALKSLNQGVMGNGESREKIYNDVRVEFEEMNNAVVSIAVETGLIGKEEANQWAVEGFYLPFYRMLEDEGTKARGPSTFGTGLVKQTAYKKLKGADLQLDDLLSNILMNWNHLIGASLKNQTAVAALESAVDMGIAEVVPKQAKSKDAIFVRKDGQEVWYEVDSTGGGSLVLDSLLSLNWTGLTGTSMNVMRSFKRILTIGVTASPTFKIRNLMRDSIQAVAVADMSTQIHKNLYEGWAATSSDSDTKANMIAGGGAFGDSGYIHGADPDAIRYLVSKGVRRNTILDSKNVLRKVWDSYQDFGARLENINRAANYEQAIKDGKDLLQANFESRDHLDFSRTGSFVAVRALAQVVPFLNARLQGLDKLGRAGMDENQRKQFASVIAVYAIASTILYLSMKDDDDYKDAEEWERDSYHLFKLPGGDTMYRLPRPFEVGAIATTMERMVEQLVDDKVHGALFAERLGHTLLETFSFSPIPQLFKPAIEIYANKNSFTKRQIESVGMKRLSATERKRVWTSETAIKASQFMDTILWDDVVLSPVQIEHLVKGYMGWAGATALAGIDMIVTRPLGDYAVGPAKGWQSLPIISAFAKKVPNSHSKYMSLFYENLRDVNEKYADIMNARKLLEFDLAKEKYEKYGDKVKWRKIYSKAQQTLAKINARTTIIMISKKISAEQKRREMDRLSKLKNKLVKRIVEKSGEDF